MGVVMAECASWYYEGRGGVGAREWGSAGGFRVRRRSSGSESRS